MPDALPDRPSERFALAWIDRFLDHPWRVIALTLALAAAAATGIPKLAFSNNYRAYFSPTNPELVAFDELQATYAKSDNILFVVQSPGGEVFTAEVLTAIETLTEDAWQIPYATRVDSITNFQHSFGEGDDLIVENLISGAAALSTEEIAAKRAVALVDPLLLGNLLSVDADTTGLNVVLQFPEQSLSEVPAAVAAARDLARRLESELPGSRVALTGVTMLNHAFTESGQRDATTLMPWMFVLVSLFLVFTLRSLAAALATLAVVGLATTMALGLAGHLGISLSPVAINAPTIIMTLAVADSVHILSTLLTALGAGASKTAALRESVRINLVAVLITSLTTAIGFLTFNFADSPPFRDLGNITALGIGAALLCSLTLLPALVVLLPVRARRGYGNGDRLSSYLDRLGARVVRHRRAALGATLAAAAICIAFLPRLDLNDQWVDYFDDRIRFRRDADFAIERLTGLYPIEFSVAAGEPEGISDPRYLETLESFTTWLRRQPEVRHVFSYADIIRRLNRNLHADDPTFYRMPAERDLAAQYLLLYELSLPFGLDLNDRISVDKSATRVTASLGDLTTRDTRAFIDRARAWFVDHAPVNMRAVPTGPAVMFAHVSQRNIESMLGGNVLAILVIAGVMALALRSLPLGLLSLVPNTLPVLMTFGLWALAGGKVGMAAAMVSVSSLGIIVDDTVHFLTKYSRTRSERGLDRSEAVRETFRTVGGAIVTTTTILAAGFLILALSTFRINFELGLLTAIAIVIALAMDLFMLPSLLLWGFRTDRKEIAHRDSLPVRS